MTSLKALAPVLLLVCMASAANSAQHAARVLTPRLALAPGETGIVMAEVDPAPGGGVMVSVLAKVLEQPAGAAPEIVTGYPETRFAAEVPGSYLLEVRITLVFKSSCGGVEARELAREEVRVHIE